MSLNPAVADWRGRVVWIVGASSGIGRATASQLHAGRALVVVSARGAAALNEFVAGHPGSVALPLDVADRAAFSTALQQLLSLHGKLDLAMYCAGRYQAMRATEFDLDEMQRHLQVNYVGAMYMLDAVLKTVIAQGHGHISLVSSVAGYRGLPKAMAYGPTKAALQQLAETLYLDLHPLGIGVSVINPGFVATTLTAGNAFTMPALLTPEQAASHILQGWARGRFDIHFPKRFTFWLKLLRLLPYGLYFAAVQRTTGA